MEEKLLRSCDKVPTLLDVDPVIGRRLAALPANHEDHAGRTEMKWMIEKWCWVCWKLLADPAEPHSCSIIHGLFWIFGISDFVHLHWYWKKWAWRALSPRRCCKSQPQHRSASFTCSSQGADLTASPFASVGLCHIIAPIFRITFSCITWLLLTLNHACLLNGMESKHRLCIQASGGFSTNKIQLKVLAQGCAWQQHDLPFFQTWSDLIWYHQITSRLFSPRLVRIILRICPNKDAAVERQMAHLISIWSQVTFWG